ncbi:MAG: hypothetical protein R3C24_03615 [Cyanobacteriota/Melainabacteria group bacterium]
MPILMLRNPEVAPRAEQGISKITSQRKEAERQVKLGDATEKKLPGWAEDHYKQSLIADPLRSRRSLQSFLPLYEREEGFYRAHDRIRRELSGSL